MDHIVVGTDFSAPSVVAVRAAAHLANRLDARLTVAHNYDPMPIGLGSVRPTFWPALDVSQGCEKYAEAEFKKLAQGTLADVPHDTVVLSHASSSSALCDYAANVGAGLLVVGTRGRTGLKRMLIGSVAEQAARQARCAVLAVRQFDGQADSPRTTHIRTARLCTRGWAWVCRRGTRTLLGRHHFRTAPGSSGTR